ncbi:hypothetical protein HS048_28915 [Planomonospora sp. ID91781]|uniref:hypothetical protein n=1 Tax=Planomonospora sp. ID91781 TaxID=2738135 RepID=UPI0018C40516|nr:hypothetical protein [Planomonospora sp. ID91781]MBG0824731.1 hypothetical protein [Planomonospora sp. ID91781]
MRVELPAPIRRAGTDPRTRSPHRHGHPARDLKPTVRTDPSRRPAAAPRRSGH